MDLCILRHAHAEKTSPDFERRLTEGGFGHIRALGEFLKGKACLHIDSIWCSPLVRAEQTAKVFIEHAGLYVTPERSILLEPDRNVRELMAKILEKNRNTLLVGHNPQLEELLSFLLMHSSDSGTFVMSEGVFICLRQESSPKYRPPFGRWSLRYFLNSSLFEKI
ncbi:MAG: hypothetical protein A2Y14_01225 [Verrucomicrobia bacterium GWF2_51_19]|nr:MAG: hypothetical protein A2Y14_01225 [Verrucomicrobia bacterium GWF2_51_19]